MGFETAKMKPTKTFKETPPILDQFFVSLS